VWNLRLIASLLRRRWLAEPRPADPLARFLGDEALVATASMLATRLVLSFCRHAFHFQNFLQPLTVGERVFFVGRDGK